MWGLISRDPVGRKWTTLIYVMLARLLLLVVMLLIWTVAMRPAGRDAGFYVFVALSFVITIAYAVWLRQDETVESSALYQFAVDALVITGLVHFSGGINSQLSLLYPLVVLSAGIVVSGRMALKVAMLSVFAYATLVVLEMSGSLVYRGMPPSPYTEPAQVLQLLMLRVLIMMLFAAASSYLADRCFYQDKQLQRLRLVAQAIFDNVAVPLLAVHPDGRIVLANPAAQNMLAMPERGESGRRFSDLFPGAVPELDSDEDAARIWSMLRCDGSEFPVTFEVSSSDFPAVAVGSLAERGDGVRLHLVALRDMTELLRREDAATASTRSKTAKGVIAEMAHVVRNPLTAIRGAGQLLDSAVDSMFEQASQINESDWSAVKAMCSIIYQQTQELDDKVAYFLRCASEDPERMRELLVTADAWASRIFPGGDGTDGENPPG